MVKIACIQLNSSHNIQDNINKIDIMVRDAKGRGADIVCTPENTFLMEKSGAEKIFYSEEEHPAVKASSEIAAKYGVWLLIGSIAIATGETGNKAGIRKNYNRLFLFNPQGKIEARYDKIHLFDVEVGDGQVYRESEKFIAGSEAVVADTPFGKIGLTICYDIRFPYLYRALAKAGAKIIFVPAAFTAVTGAAHWHVLLRARAIENGCFIVAPAQTGTHAGGRKTYGHSLIINPWGEVIADGGEDEVVVTADIDLSEIEKIRGKLPSLSHDREFTLSCRT